MTTIKVPWIFNRKLIKISDEQTNPKYGYKPYDRPYPEILKYAVINLDKPSGPSSHEVAAWVKNILKIKRAGHSGTLAVKS